MICKKNYISIFFYSAFIFYFTQYTSFLNAHHHTSTTYIHTYIHANFHRHRRNRTHDPQNTIQVFSQLAIMNRCANPLQNGPLPYCRSESKQGTTVLAKNWQLDCQFIGSYFSENSTVKQIHFEKNISRACSQCADKGT